MGDSVVVLDILKLRTNSICSQYCSVLTEGTAVFTIFLAEEIVGAVARSHLLAFSDVFILCNWDSNPASFFTVGFQRRR